MDELEPGADGSHNGEEEPKSELDKLIEEAQEETINVDDDVAGQVEIGLAGDTDLLRDL